MTLGKKLQLLRKARGMSQEQLAEALGVSRQAVSKWELDATLPDTANVLALGKMFGVTTDYLLVEENEETVRSAPAADVSGRKVNVKVIVGIIMAGIGALGWAAVYIASRFVEVMVPYTYSDEFGHVWTEYNSTRTDVNFGLFMEEYHLEGLLIVLAVMIASGIILMIMDTRVGMSVRRLRDRIHDFWES